MWYTKTLSQSTREIYKKVPVHIDNRNGICYYLRNTPYQEWWRDEAR